MSVNLVNGDTLNSDFTAICNAIRTKGGASGQIAYAPGNTTNIVSAINNIPSGGGGGNPTFTETVICDNTALSTGNLTFTDDFENYDLLDIELYNTSSLVDFHILTIPSVLSAIKNASSNQVNFNEVGNNQYKCYTLSADNLTWTVRGSRNLIIKSVKGLVCDNMTVTTTEFYKRNSISPVVATIEPIEDIADYDYIFFGIGDGASDQTQPCNIPIRIDKNDFGTSLGVWHRYNNAGLPIFIDHHSIVAPVDYYGNNYFILCAYGVKFE